MERKSIGRFIAALRKANGMTQKSLAEMLGVSDKAVSRWERDECAPDISLIPVIAEIFGVTSDEILCGEKSNKPPVYNEGNAKTEKRLKHLINTVKTKFIIKSIISLSAAIVGLIISMICNFGFYRARLGFLVGCIMFLIAVLLEIIFFNYAFLVVNSDDFFAESINNLKKSLILEFRNTLFAILCIFAFSLPPAYLASDAYYGVYYVEWFSQGAICSLAGAAICIIAWLAAKQILIKHKILILTEGEKEKRKIQRKAILASSIVLVTTFFVQSLLINNESFIYKAFIKGTTFTDMNKFIEYIETPKDEWSEQPTSASEEYTPEQTENEVTYEEDENDFSDNNEYSDSYAIEYWKDTIKIDGKSVTFEQKNLQVIRIDYKLDKDNNVVSATTYTQKDREQARIIIDRINIIFFIVYIAEITCLVLKYFLKTKKLKIKA